MDNIPDSPAKWLLEVNIWSQVLEKSSEEFKSYYNRGIAYAKLGKVQEALDDFEEYLKHDPKDPETHFEIGVNQEKLENWELAADAYTKSIEYSEEGTRNHDSYYNRGLCFDQLGKYDEALQDYDKFIERFPKDTKVLSRKGNIYLKLKQLDKCLEMFKKCVELKPNLHKNQFQLAMFYDYHVSLSDDPEKETKTLEHYTRCIEIDPTIKSPFFNRGVVYEHKEEYQNALRDFYSFNKLDPKNPEAFFHIGYLYKAQEKFEYALKCLNSAIKFDPNHVDSYFNRGMVYKELEKYSESLQDFLKHLTYIDPEESEGEEEVKLDTDKSDKAKADTYFQVAFLYGDLMEPNELEKAVENYTKCLKFNPVDKEAILNRGIAQRKLKKYEAAQKDFKRFQEVTEEHKDLVNYQMGMVMREMKKFEEAIRHFETSLKHDKENCDALFDLAGCFFTTKEYTKSVENYDKILKLYPDDHECWYKKAGVLKVMGSEKKQQALESINKALSFEKEKEEYLKLKKEIEEV